MFLCHHRQRDAVIFFSFNDRNLSIITLRSTTRMLLIKYLLLLFNTFIYLYLYIFLVLKHCKYQINI